MRSIDYIIIHHSASGWGDAALIDQWHRNRKPVPFRMIGYHWVVLNGKRSSKASVNHHEIGMIEPGRPEGDRGAHCIPRNKDSIGVCLVGKFSEKAPHSDQWRATIMFVADKCREHGIAIDNVLGHRECDATACPGYAFPMDNFRRGVEALVGADTNPGPPTPNPDTWEREVADAVKWAKRTGISDCERPDDKVTRKEQVVIAYRLYRAMGE